MTLTAEAQTFGADEVLAALEKIVRGREGYIDPRSKAMGLPCKYVLDGVPSCIVGQALFALGVPIKVLQEMDFVSDPMFAEDGGRVLSGHGYTFTGGARDMLVLAQEEQDGGRTWGVALDVARQTHAAYMS